MSGSNYTSLRDYYLLLSSNRLFLILWTGEIVNELGGWFNLVACFSLVEELTGNVGVSLSVMLIMRSAPRLVWFMVAGALADSFNRAGVMVVSALLQGVVLLAFPLVRVTKNLGFLYTLVFLQWSFATVYDPAKSALIPQIVSSDHLHLAATLDSFAWSFMAAVGASAGGFAVAYFGPTICFLVDAGSFLVAASCAARLIPHASRPQRGYAALTQADPEDVGHEVHNDFTHADTVDQDPEKLIAAAETGVPVLENIPLLLGKEEPVKASLTKDPTGPDPHPVLLRIEEGDTSLRGILVKGALAARSGMAYLLARDNWDAAVLTTLKASGGLAWGAADVLNAKLGDTKGVQLSSGAASTVGLLYAAVGIGCIAGPVAINSITPANPRGWMRSASAAFGLLSLGYLLMLPFLNLPMCMLATASRSAGSNIVWIYSTTLLQKRVDPAAQGSVFAVDMALFTLGSSVSSIWAGEAFGSGLLTVRGMAFVMGCVSAGFAVVWSVHAAVKKLPEDEQHEADKTAATAALEMSNL